MTMQLMECHRNQTVENVPLGLMLAYEVEAVQPAVFRLIGDWQDETIETGLKRMVDSN